MSRTCTVALFIALAATSTVSAGEIALEATIPFEFYVGNTRLPAGDYAVKRLDHTGLISVRSANGEAGAFVSTHGTQARKIVSDGKLVFTRYGDTHFLSQVWRPGTNLGLEVAPSRTQQEMKVARSTRDVQVASAKK